MRSTKHEQTHAGLLFLLAVRRLPGLLYDGLGRSFFLHAAATLVMGAAVLGWTALLHNAFDLESAWADLVGGVLVGTVVYGVAALAMGSAEIGGIRDLVSARLARSWHR